MLHYLVMLLRFSNGVLLLSAVLGPYLSGRAFDCRSRGLRFEPGWALSLFFFVTSFSQAKLLTNLFYDLKIRHKSSRVLELYSSCL